MESKSIAGGVTSNGSIIQQVPEGVTRLFKLATIYRTSINVTKSSEERE